MNIIQQLDMCLVRLQLQLLYRAWPQGSPARAENARHWAAARAALSEQEDRMRAQGREAEMASPYKNWV